MRSRAFRGPQSEIVVLGQIELFAKAAELIDERTPVRRQVTDIHRRTKKLRAPFRLEKRRVPFAFFAPSIFIAVKDVGLGRVAKQRAPLHTAQTAPADRHDRRRR